MSQEPFRVRRATLDDLPTLRPLWESMRLNTAELERRLTEFQVVVDSNGAVVGGLGFEISQRYAKLYGEAYSDFSLADIVRPLLWTRLQALALNHGIVRMWTREEAPFWKQNGFLPADAETLKRLPAAWTELSGTWLTLSLKDEDSIVSLEKELALFMEAEKQRTARAMGQAQALKKFATIVALLLAAGVTVLMIYLLRQNFGR